MGQWAGRNKNGQRLAIPPTILADRIFESNRQQWPVQASDACNPAFTRTGWGRAGSELCRRAVVWARLSHRSGPAQVCFRARQSFRGCLTCAHDCHVCLDAPPTFCAALSTSSTFARGTAASDHPPRPAGRGAFNPTPGWRLVVGEGGVCPLRYKYVHVLPHPKLRPGKAPSRNERFTHPTSFPQVCLL